MTAASPTIAAVPVALGEGSAEDALRAALRVHGGDLLEFAGQVTAEMRQDGVISAWLLRDIRRTVTRLSEALTEFDKEKRANG